MQMTLGRLLLMIEAHMPQTPSPQPHHSQKAPPHTHLHRRAHDDNKTTRVLFKSRQLSSFQSRPLGVDLLTPATPPKAHKYGRRVGAALHAGLAQQ